AVARAARRGNREPGGMGLSFVCRKTGTATNSRLWNWLAVPGLPRADTPPLAPPIFIPTDEVLPHNATDLCVSASRRGKTRPLSKMPDSCVCRKTGTATNFSILNWLAVPGLPTADTPPLAPPIFIPTDEVLPHNATDLCVSASRRGKTRPLSKMPDSCVCRKTRTATNSRLWNWLAVPGLPTADTPPLAPPIFIPTDEVLPHNATDLCVSAGKN